MRAAAGLKAAHDSGELPLDVMLRRMHGDMTITDQQFEAAVAAAPYVHPRMAAMAVQTVPEPDPAEEALRTQQRAELIAALQAMARAEPLLIEGDALAEGDSQTLAVVRPKSNRRMASF
jgi:hypothetical protein